MASAPVGAAPVRRAATTLLVPLILLLVGGIVGTAAAHSAAPRARARARASAALPLLLFVSHASSSSGSGASPLFSSGDGGGWPITVEPSPRCCCPCFAFPSDGAGRRRPSRPYIPTARPPQRRPPRSSSSAVRATPRMGGPKEEEGQRQQQRQRGRDITTTGDESATVDKSTIGGGEATASEEASSSSGDGKKLSRKERKFHERRADYERRLALWSSRYGSVDALRQTFGSGPPGGDLTPLQTRRLYHALLPRSLLGLYQLGLMRPEELAPLAYEARIAAKGYARSRSAWTGRLLSQAFDQFRSLRDRGRFVGSGGKSSGSDMYSWDRLWNKYEAQILAEECTEEVVGHGTDDDADASVPSKVVRVCRIDEEALTSRIYLRILERSVATNEAFDELFLTEDECYLDGEIEAMARKLEEDVRAILLEPKEGARVAKKEEEAEREARKEEERARKREEKATREAEKLEEKTQKEAEKAERKAEKEVLKEEQTEERRRRKLQRRQRRRRDEEEDEGGPQRRQRQREGDEDDDVAEGGGAEGTTDEIFERAAEAIENAPGRKRWDVLRILAETRRKFREF